MKRIICVYLRHYDSNSGVLVTVPELNRGRRFSIPLEFRTKSSTVALDGWIELEFLSPNYSILLLEGSVYILGVINECRKLPLMPTPRSDTGAAHIPGVGDLVVGGYVETGDDSRGVHKAEIVLTTSSPLGYAGSGCEIAPFFIRGHIQKQNFSKEKYTSLVIC
ncbi:unnamed protein product [Rodentolepis nana]|uniref:DUF5675 domain-containing protein n=1 Tax=Rodentolepis nana TaxID=102285 RepID=A0A0R3T7F0_RODNA|nr:unnamed protein product [Rodentolepis nana]